MSRLLMRKGWLVMVLIAVLLAMLPATARAVINGITGPTFHLSAKDGEIIMGDGLTAYIWGYANQGADPNFCPAGDCVQYPGPTLIVNQGDLVTVTLVNKIPRLPGNPPVPNVSIVFPGQIVTASGGIAPPTALITNEAPADGVTMVTYAFTASNPGTYSYFSGTRMDLEVEMGLIGALIVRPKNGVNGCVLPALPPTQAIFAPLIGSPPGVFAPIPAALPINGVPTSTLSPSRGFAYCTIDGYYDREYLELVTEMDPAIHQKVSSGQMAQVGTTDWRPTNWFVNGRNFPDTAADDFSPWLPAQPYSNLPLTHPGENFLIRFIGGGRALHPMHPHGQNHNIIARDAQLLQSPAGAIAGRADLPISDFTTTTVPGETVDATWGPWTGIKLNWDVYGHANLVDPNQIDPAPCTAPPAPGEYLADHCKPFPVAFPAQDKMTYGQMWGGTPFLGLPGNIPAIDPNTGEYHSDQNPMGAQSFMFHSHSEREITTNNIFIGGAATMMMIMPWTDMNGNLIPIP